MSERDLAERRGRVDSTLTDHNQKLEDHDERITRTEKFMYMILGGLSVLSIVFGSAELAGLLGAL